MTRHLAGGEGLRTMRVLVVLMVLLVLQWHSTRFPAAVTAAGMALLLRAAAPAPARLLRLRTAPR
ncbi:hypothetical protein [Phaeacidiphilus oryzae]|uniref:hypothetical protein n=1 Tax=Phaeacidiphilus oryzae TaxID=348818 RepID=UPI00055E23FC|nr:hypothetical protein [Phaeacidiphilus oryzae]